MSTNTDRVLEVEKLVDDSTLFDVVAAIELMCYEKAAHIRANWQDNDSAKQWDRCAKALYRANLVIVSTNV